MKRDKHDKAASDLVRAINKNTCQHCRQVKERTECAHIFGRRHQATRYDLDNLLCLCHSCHRRFTENPVDFTRWLTEYMGKEKLDALMVKAWSVKKWAAGEKEELYKRHKEMLGAL